MGTGRKRLGAVGEQLAVTWYERHGFTVLARNWRSRHGEIDLIVRRGDVVVFAEVKSRSSTAFGHPAEAVTWRKQQRIRRLAAAWLAEAGLRAPVTVRFDVVGILAGRLDVVEAAF
ncbi:MAG: YraN family protein [Acidimicrobiales bacterium]|nr:YraN family protein [Acidimicrobiales bacterium]